MAENKTQKTRASVAAFLNTIPDAGRRKDARALAALIRKATGSAPAMWGSSIVGYGDCTYEGRGGRSVEWFTVGFSPRKAALAIYLMGGLGAHGALLRALGPHKVGGGCLYIKQLEGVDTKVLGRLIAGSHAANRNLTRKATTARRASKRSR